MAAKFLQLETSGANAGMPKEVELTVISSGVGNAGDGVALDSAGKLDISVMPTGIGADTVTAIAGENLSAGNLVYINGSGQVLKADASSSTKGAIGFVIASVTSGNSATVYMEGSITGLSSLTPGARYYLSNSIAGAISLYSGLTFSPGHISQYVGPATSATVLSFEPDLPIVKA